MSIRKEDEMSRRIFLVAVSVMLLSMQQPAVGHHSFAVEFTAEETAVIKGVVAEVWFNNPHVRYYIDVTNDDGEIERWDTRGSSPSLLVRRGWTKKTISVGDTVTIKGHLGRDDKRLLSIIGIELADGTKLGQSY
jgi:hypothetical protein